MTETKREPDETLPLELKLRVLQAELDRLDSDLKWLKARKHDVERQITDFQDRLTRTRRRLTLRRVK
jgi:predicted  nucleic acid-binding Zn-ribbon protein